MLQISNVQEQSVETLGPLQKLLLVLASCSGEVPGKEICKYMEMKYAEKYGEQHSSNKTENPSKDALDKADNYAKCKLCQL